MSFDYDAFLSERCYCGHTRGEHKARVSYGHCHVCRDGHYFTTVEHHERDLREAALQADPTHVHGPTHTAYACPGFVPFQVCDACGATVR